jgi:predicted MFS family arabinose efflux permease
VAGVGALSGAALVTWIPRTDALHAGPIRQELAALRRPLVWSIMTVAALGISSIFAVYIPEASPTALDETLTPSSGDEWRRTR